MTALALTADELAPIRRFVSNGHRLVPGEIAALVATLDAFERVVIAADLVTRNGPLGGEPWWAALDDDHRIVCSQCDAVGDSMNPPDHCEHDRDCVALELGGALALARPSVAGLEAAS
jgi:hypothetical protein